MVTQALSELESHYEALRDGVGLLERPRGKLELIGPEAVEFLQGQVTNDVEALEPGSGCYALLLNPKGRILADMRILLRSAQQLWLDTEASTHEVLRSSLQRYKIGRQVEIRDHTDDRSILSLIGPTARE